VRTPSAVAVLAATALLACNAILDNGHRELDVVDFVAMKSGDASVQTPDDEREEVAARTEGAASRDARKDAASEDASRCAKGAGAFEDPQTGHCYQFFGVGKTWADAEASCIAKGGHLAAVTSDAEMRLVAGALGAISPKIWFGASDVAAEASFTWTTGEPFSFAPWGVGEPNNDGEEDCVNAKPADGWKWNDGLCSEANSYLCES
jgi:hypothetical protein